MAYTPKNYLDDGGDKTVIGGEIEFTAASTVNFVTGATVTGLTEATTPAGSALGGVKAAAAGAGDTVECKIKAADSKLYVPAYPVLVAAGTNLGGVKAAAKGEGDTVECKIDAESEKLYVPTYPISANVPVAAGSTPTKAEFDALIGALITAGLMAAAEG